VTKSLWKNKIKDHQHHIKMSSAERTLNFWYSQGDDEWTKVVPRKYQKHQEPKVRAVKHYWNGFDEQGHEKWYIELSNGVILPSNHKEYTFWAKRYYPNR